MTFDRKDCVVCIVHYDQGGMQPVGRPTGVKVTHTPTGLEATVKADRLQHKALQVALAMIEYGVSEL